MDPLPAAAAGHPLLSGMGGFGQLELALATESLLFIPGTDPTGLSGEGLIAAAVTGTFPSRSGTDWRCVPAGGHR